MNVNFFVTCIRSILKSRMARDSVCLLEKLRAVALNFPEKQGCCGEPPMDEWLYQRSDSRDGNFDRRTGGHDDPIISPAGSCTYAVKSYPTYLADEPEWASRAEKVAARMKDLTSFIVNKLGVVDVRCQFAREAVYSHCVSLARKLGVKDEPLTLLLKNVVTGAVDLLNRIPAALAARSQ
ncbi:heterodisulfide reductase-related iron-sulfur binding cluster [Escherichia coli]